MPPLRLVLRNLTRHPWRSLLTIGSFVVAIFLLCTMRGLVETLEMGTNLASARRLWVQSAVSLYVDLPIHYTEKIRRVEGVEEVCKWQWFGGYYQDPENFFGQFAIDQDVMFDMYPELDVVEGSADAFLGNRTGCMVGRGTAQDFGWEVGDRIPIIGALFPHPDGVAWEFDLEAIYEPTVRNWDDRTLYFHWDVFEKTLEGSESGTSVGVISVLVEPGVDPTSVMAEIDRMFENGPQRVQTTSESEFNAQFVSMWGNIPFLLSSLGGGVLVAILVGCLNAMLIAAREQTNDVGVLKALGFTDATVFGVMIGQALTLSLVGGLLGLGLTLAMEPSTAHNMGAFIPGYEVSDATLLFGLATSLVVGVLAGIAPAWRASRLGTVEALRSTE